jgi:DUF2997 family protein
MGLKQEIEITISPEGEVHLHVQGVTGPKCLEITKDFQEALGVIVKNEKTSEYYKSEEHKSIKAETTDEHR